MRHTKCHFRKEKTCNVHRCLTERRRPAARVMAAVCMRHTKASLREVLNIAGF